MTRTSYDEIDSHKDETTSEAAPKVVVEILNLPDDWVPVDLDSDFSFGLGDHIGAEKVRVRTASTDPWLEEVTTIEEASPEENEAINAYTSKTANGRRATLCVGNLTLEVGPEYKTTDEVNWMRWMLAKAILELRKTPKIIESTESRRVEVNTINDKTRQYVMVGSKEDCEDDIPF